MTKWPDRPHWRFAGRYLGSDRHGDWLAFPAGSRFSRPGADVTMPNDQVGLVPADALPERGWLATFHGPGSDFRLYVDIATPPAWDADVLRSVDLDLDVIQDHRVRWAYPEALVAAALQSCAHVESAVRRGVPPFDGSHRGWLAQVADPAGQ
jgi:hypothetical protein